MSESQKDESGSEPEAQVPEAPVPTVRVEVFVDGSNFHPSVEGIGVTHPIAFGALAQALTSAVGGTVLVRLNYVAGVYPEPNSRDPNLAGGEYAARLARKRSTDQLYARIAEEPGVRVWRERFKYRHPSARDVRPVVEKGSDVRNALLMYEGARDDRYDVAVLVASDADFTPAVQMVCGLKKRVVWAYCAQFSRMRDLVDAGAERFELTAAFLGGCVYVPKTPVGSATGIAGRV